jgi:hypothetical protein
MTKKLLFIGLVAASLLNVSCFKELDITETGEIGDQGGSGGSGGSGGGGGGNSSNITSGLIAYYSFDGENANDLSGHSADASFYGEPTFVQGTKGKAVFLNFLDGHFLNIPQNLFSDLETWSVSFWIKDFGPGNLFSAQNSNYSNENYDAPKLWATQEGRFSINLEGGYISNSGTDFSYSYLSAQADGNWHHVTVVASGVGGYDYATVKLYVDGSLRDQISCNSYMYTINNCTKIAFGGDKDGGYGYASNMKIDNIRIYNRAISATEVQTIRNDEQ